MTYAKVTFGFFSLLFIFYASQKLSPDLFLEDRLQSSIQRSLRSVVRVSKPHSEASLGAGFLVNREKRFVVTSYHIVVNTHSLVIQFWQDKEVYPCRIISTDPERDLALLEVQGDESLFPPALKLQSDDQIELGQFAIAIGSPGGFDFSASLGIVSSLNRELQDVHTQTTFLQVDTPMFRGSSGGPLINLNGEVVGINSRGGANGTVAFAIPVMHIRAALKEVEE